ncbi:MAG: ACT domain-containing protein [Acidimicrobiales bacterium]
MTTDLTVVLDDTPGTLAELGEATGKAGINLDGCAGFTRDGRGEIHLLVEDGPAASQALREAGYTVEGAREVIVVDVDDRPGSLGDAARKVADTGANIQVMYLATNTRLVFGVDDIDAARAALS